MLIVDMKLANVDNIQILEVIICELLNEAPFCTLLKNNDFFNRIGPFWYSFEFDIVNTKSIGIFKERIDNLVFSNYLD